MKVCTKCNVAQDYSEFISNATGADPNVLTKQCAKCRRSSVVCKRKRRVAVGHRAPAANNAPSAPKGPVATAQPVGLTDHAALGYPASKSNTLPGSPAIGIHHNYAHVGGVHALGQAQNATINLNFRLYETPVAGLYNNTGPHYPAYDSSIAKNTLVYDTKGYYGTTGYYDTTGHYGATSHNDTPAYYDTTAYYDSNAYHGTTGHNHTTSCSDTTGYPAESETDCESWPVAFNGRNVN